MPYRTREFERGPYYEGLRKSIENDPNKVLNLSLQGTSDSANAPTAHRLAMEPLKNTVPEKAVVTFTGLGGTWDPFNPNMHILAPSHSIEPRNKGDKSQYDRKLGKISEEEGLNAISGAGDGIVPEFGAILFGYGLKSSVDTIINLLHAMKNDPRGNCLPKTLCLGGHSRGAVASIVLANRIWKEFGPEIKINIVITDPVPGPQLRDDYEKYVIPPNVESFNVTYATAGVNKNLNGWVDKGARALDPHKFVIANPRTQVTCVGIEGVDHKEIPKHPLAKSMANTVIARTNNMEPNPIDLANIDRCSPNVQSRGARKGISYHRVVGPANKMVKEVRETVIENYAPKESNLPPQDDFLAEYRNQGPRTAEDRGAEIKGLFRTGIGKRPDTQEGYIECSRNYARVMDMRKAILEETKNTKQGKYQCNIGSLFSAKKYITPFQKECLKYINKMNKKANCDPHSLLWEETLKGLQQLWDKEMEKEKKMSHQKSTGPADLPEASKSLEQKLDSEEYKFIANFLRTQKKINININNLSPGYKMLPTK